MAETKPTSQENPLAFEEPLIELERKIAELKDLAETKGMDLADAVRTLEEQMARRTREIYSRLTPWQRIQLARHPGRPMTSDYLQHLFGEFIELHGDRCFGDDGAIACGPARFRNRWVMLIANRKGRNTKERVRCNFGMPHPEGYRKAMEKMRLAERFGLPVVCLINTPGAYPGIGAEERGQAMAIGRNLAAMSALRTPIVCIVTGEGFSGGALGIGVGDRLLMLENAVFSVISPEGCAAILWKDGARAADAAEVLKLTAADIFELGIADEVVPEPLGGAHRNPKQMAEILGRVLDRHIEELDEMPPEGLLEQRYRKYRKIGELVDARDGPSTSGTPVVPHGGIPRDETPHESL